MPPEIKKDIVLVVLYSFCATNQTQKGPYTMPYNHLTPFERGQIHALSVDGRSNAYIARALQRHPATIGRELRRNGRQCGYDAMKAQQKYRERREECRPARKMDYLPLWHHVIEKIGDKNSPEAIAGRWCISTTWKSRRGIGRFPRLGRLAAAAESDGFYF